ncbi:MAG: carbohydrate porin [Candidatus Omnitrophota bacterium]
MRRMKTGFIFSFVFLFTMAPSLFADDNAQILEKLKSLEDRVATLESKLVEHQQCILDQKTCIAQQQEKLDAYEAKIKELDPQLHRQMGTATFVGDGFRIGAGATMIVQGTNNANGTQTVKSDRSDVSFSEDITIEKEFNNINGRAFIHLESGQGDGLEDELIVFSNVNRDADNDNNVRLTEAWYEQSLFKNKMMLVTFGKLDPTVYFDNNEVANDETTQFLGRIFRNNPAIDFPDNTAGVRMALLRDDWVEFNVGVFDADADWEELGDSFCNMGEVTFKTKFFGQEGNYRLLGWYNNAPHTKWSDTSKTKEATFGVSMSIDQKVSDTIMLFGRYGWEDPRVYNPAVTASDDSNYSVGQSWSAGFQIEGPFKRRDKDVFGFAIGQVVPSIDYKKADSSRRAKAEGHLETYYSFFINDHLRLSPDFQYIWNPFGKDVADDTDGIAVFGMRAQVDF